MEKRRNSQEMFPVIESYLQRTISREEFLLKHNIQLGVLQYWLKKYHLKSKPAPSDKSVFIELPKVSSVQNHSIIKIICPSGLRIELPFK